MFNFPHDKDSWYRLMLWKAYFDEGYGFTSYIKYLIAVIGISDAIINRNIWFVVGLGLVYGVLCFFLGAFIFKSGMKDATLDVQNAVNPHFQRVEKYISDKG